MGRPYVRETAVPFVAVNCDSEGIYLAVGAINSFVGSKVYNSNFVINTPKYDKISNFCNQVTGYYGLWRLNLNRK